MTVNIYFDEWDEERDGFGWNMIHDDDAIALRHETIAAAYASACVWHPQDVILWGTDGAPVNDWPVPDAKSEINPFDVVVIR